MRPLPRRREFHPVGPAARPRVLDFNEPVRAAAARHSVAVVESTAHEVTTDRRLWCPDRLHCDPVGHARIAGAVADALGLPRHGDSWAAPPGARSSCR